MENLEGIAKVPIQPVGWIEIELPESTMLKLQDYIETAKENPVNASNMLAGQISQSLYLKDKNDWFFKNIIVGLISKYIELYPTYLKQVNVLTEEVPFCMSSFWVNFQKETEFNPFHNHSGLWSFVVWVKIPTDWREQHALPISANSNSAKASDFEFQYMTMLGNITYSNFPLDKNSEGGMLFFPAQLMHAVYPFYNCDEERISISGNICYDVSNSF